MGRIRNDGRDELARLYAPQVEQFGIELRPIGDALMGAVSNELADATVCVHRIEGLAVVTSHRIRVRRDMPFVERGGPGLCVCTLSSDSLALCQVEGADQPSPEGNVAVFGVGGGERTTPLAAGSVQDATSMTLLPAWFDRLGPTRRETVRSLVETVRETCPHEEGRLLDALLREVSPLFGGRLVSERRMVEQLDRVSEAAISWHAERERAERAAGTLRQARLARAARGLVLQHLSEPISIDSLARDLLTSRSRLCAAFRRETGEPLGGYVRRKRMERAEQLLGVPSLTVAEVAAEVGYSRTSSFTVAFEREHGRPPSAWRREAG